MQTKIIFGSAADLPPTGRTVAIVDRRVAELYPHLTEGRECLLFDAAERNKTLATTGKLYKELMRLSVDRSTFLLGIGGGITTDLTGFVAATYMRGLRFGFVPTTLLAQVDAAIGGKNGVNVDRYKNMVGTIRRPEFVVCDPEVLKTLPPRELRAGLAEVVKAAIVGDPTLFEELEKEIENGEWRMENYCFHSPFSILHSQLIVRSVAVKTKIVEADEYESGERRLLNLGHTLGHAIEKCDPKINHGEAVAIGIAMISRVAVAMNLLGEIDCDRIITVLKNIGLQTTTSIPVKKLLRAAAQDKKHDAEKIHIVLPVAIGRCAIRPMTLPELHSLLTSTGRQSM